MKYFPFPAGTTLGTRLYQTRLITGKTQEQVANLIGCDETNLRMIELNERAPQVKTHEKIEAFIRNAFEGLKGMPEE